MFKRINFFIVSIASFLVLIFIWSMAEAQRTLYVNVATPYGWAYQNGSRERPYKTIKQGIDNAVEGDRVLVASGTYNERITLKNGVKVIGGSFSTINGDFRGTVVTAIRLNSRTLFAGFTIINGYNSTVGGGMYIYESSLTVRDCIFYNNWVKNAGGGIRILGGSPSVEYCRFENNYAVDFYRDDKTFGGGMSIHYSSSTVTNCIFRDNIALSGGGMALQYSNDKIINCRFEANGSESGGALYNSGGSTYIEGNPKIINSIFWKNEARLGGGIFNGISGRSTVPLYIINCTFYDNKSTLSSNIPGGINSNAPLYVYNSILRKNGTYQIGSSANVRIHNSNVQGYSSDPWYSNIDVDPLFRDPENGDFRLLPGSLCIDNGYMQIELPSRDFEGNPRVADGDGNGSAIVDMGADEYYTNYGGFRIYYGY